MSRKLYALLLPVLAVAAMATTAGVAQAAPEWEICKNVGAGNGTFSDSECEIAKAGGEWGWVKPGGAAAKVQVVTFGKLTFAIGAPANITIECKVLDGGNIWNEGGAGKAEITAFFNYECKVIAGVCAAPAELIAEKLPWSGVLEAGPVLKVTGITINAKCGGVSKGVFTGTLTPKIEHSAGHPWFANFTAATGELEEPTSKVKAKVTGKDYVETEEGEEVRAK